MRISILSALSISILIYSCVPQSEHDKIISEKDAIVQERDRLKQEIDDIKFGAPNLLTDGITFYNAKDYIKARQKFQMLVEKHPDLPQSSEAKKYLSNIDEEELWNNAIKLNDISYVETYILKYPKGKYHGIALDRRNELRILNRQKAYESAINQNSSYGWKTFLEQYPDFEDAAAIRKKIIRLEVDEILGDQETGKIPSFNQYNSNYSSNSSVAITNNTGCELTVRYSGPDAEMITISTGRTRTVYLSSGSYKITASACGANYAGTESLHGEYGSTFYITTTRY